jgi:WhiB family redox-sensing transcriptional regulator
MIRELTLRSITDRQDRGCVDVDAAVFYPRRQTPGAIDYAKRFCDRCPVTDDCRAYALMHDLEGIWGGNTEAERRAAAP